MHEVFVVQNKIELFDTVIKKTDTVLDVGFWGQAKTHENPTWPHRLIKERVEDLYGIDLVYDETVFPESERHKYQKAAAEDFTFDRKFDVIFAGDLIEHLVNPGLFLDNAKKHIDGGRLVLTTPNTFNLFVLAGKITREEPVVNVDHTFYFNRRTLEVLLQKCGWEVESFGFMYTLDYTHKESFKKKILNVLYRMLSWKTPKFYETLVVVAKVRGE
ncbi:class I SAM-dependent methyltransferase [Candidatus Pacebacteria bacterium]|nr:class I SAM-dependent methyltransferase [Candidatus Paceibacterota bacterium]